MIEWEAKDAGLKLLQHVKVWSRVLERSRPAPHFYVQTWKLGLCDTPNVQRLTSLSGCYSWHTPCTIDLVRMRRVRANDT